MSKPPCGAVARCSCASQPVSRWTPGAIRPLSDGMAEMTAVTIRSIATRIEQRLRAIAEHEAAIRCDLAMLSALTPESRGDGLVDIAAAAGWLGVSRATMFRLLRDDPYLHHLKVGNRTLFRPEDLRAYAARRVAS